MLPTLLHPEFTRLLVHTGERFDRNEWVRFNADCPGFLTYEVRERVCAGDRVAARAHVTGLVDGEVRHFEVAEFVTTRDGLIVELVELWADVDQSPPDRGSL